MRRALLLCLLALLVTAAPAAAAVPRDWLGVVADGPMTDGERPRAASGRCWPAAARPRVADRVLLVAGPAGRPGPTDFATHRRASSLAAARARPRRRPGRARHAGVGGGACRATAARRRATPPTSAASCRRWSRRYGPRGSLWTEHPELDAAPDPRLADLERAEHRPLLVDPAVREVVRAAAAHRPQRRCARPTRARARSWPACRTGAGRRCGRSTAPAAAAPSTRSRCTRTPASRSTWSSSCCSARRVMRALRRPPHAGLGDRAVVARVAGQDRRHRSGSRPTTRARRSGCARASMLLAAARRKLRIERVYWYTWLSRRGRAERVRLVRPAARCATAQVGQRAVADARSAQTAKLAASLSSASTARAVRVPGERRRRARGRPRAAAPRSAASPSSAVSAAANASPSGSASTAAPPHVSGSAPAAAATTGVPQAIASSTGSPKPS